MSELSVMESSTETLVGDNMIENKSLMVHGVGAEMVAAMAGIIDKLQQVAVGVGAAHPSYAINKFDFELPKTQISGCKRLSDMHGCNIYTLRTTLTHLHFT